MIGYHYTSWRNWESIRVHGIKPYTIAKDELLEYFDVLPKAIWVWLYEPSTKSELGSILWQVTTKAQTRIVKLQVEYRDEDILHYWNVAMQYNQRVVLPHSGFLNNWNYHNDENAVLVIKRIAPGQITLLKDINLLERIKPDGLSANY